jgi:hypothetical protein
MVAFVDVSLGTVYYVVGVENIYSDCPTRYLRKNDGYIYYSAALVIHSSSIFHPRIPRIPRIPCHLREPSISTVGCVRNGEYAHTFH